MFFNYQVFMEVGLPIGRDLGLVLGHSGFSQAFDEGVGVEGGGLSLHGARDGG